VTAIPNHNYVKKTPNKKIAAIIIKTTNQRVSESQASSKNDITTKYQKNQNPLYN